AHGPLVELAVVELAVVFCAAVRRALGYHARPKQIAGVFTYLSVASTQHLSNDTGRQGSDRSGRSAPSADSLTADSPRGWCPAWSDHCDTTTSDSSGTRAAADRVVADSRR